MTDRSRGTGGAVGPPWSVDLLADLQAGVLDEREAAELWPRVEHDPEALAILAALDSTSADLAGLAEAPAEPMPAHFAARLDAALAQESQQRAAATSTAGPAAVPAAAAEPGVAPVVSMDAARRKRNKRIGWGAGVLTAAAAAVAAIAIVVPSNSTTGGDAVAQPSSAPAPGAEPPLALQEEGLNAGAIGPAVNARDFGPLENEDRLAACMESNGIDPSIKPAGIRGVTVDGQPATLILLPSGQIGQFRLVAFAPDCGPGNPGTVFDRTVG
ncbi:hypothetical protein CFN78_13780 [Amycolatopsis antarctica]|uniref:Anti-sigma factor n=1 Tax=Amycolatopsis antarctica TaxID=1854586 RepID=A0A263D2J1_9PSEU|nr:hypothetical protein [Amycolatopsis antarctica]OZM72694.1 hypothetical protein CFN78_13780 [Amycolatopsis antarctica]